MTTDTSVTMTTYPTCKSLDAGQVVSVYTAISVKQSSNKVKPGNNVKRRTRRALSPQTLYSDSTLLVLNGTSFNSTMPFWLLIDDIYKFM